MALFESYERRLPQIQAALAQYGMKSLDEAKELCSSKGIDPYTLCKGIQPICFENAAWAYVLGAVLLIGTNFCGLAIPWLMKLAIEGLQHPSPGSFSPLQYGALIAVAAVAQGVVRVFSRTTLLNAGRKIEFLLREDLYGKLLTLDRSYFSSWRTGDILSRLANDLTNVRMLLGFGVLSLFNTLVTVLITGAKDGELIGSLAG